MLSPSMLETSPLLNHLKFSPQKMNQVYSVDAIDRLGGPGKNRNDTDLILNWKSGMPKTETWNYKTSSFWYHFWEKISLFPLNHGNMCNRNLTAEHCHCPTFFWLPNLTHIIDIKMLCVANEEKCLVWGDFRLSQHLSFKPKKQLPQIAAVHVLAVSRITRVTSSQFC